MIKRGGIKPNYNNKVIFGVCFKKTQKPLFHFFDLSSFYEQFYKRTHIEQISVNTNAPYSFNPLPLGRNEIGWSIKAESNRIFVLA